WGVAGGGVGGGGGGGGAREEDPADALLGAALVEHARKNQVQPRYSATRDPMFPAVEDISVAALVGARRHLGRGAAGVRLGNADRRLVARQNEIGRELALRGGAVFEDGADVAHVGSDQDARRCAAMLGHLFDDQRRLEVTQSLAAELLRNGHAE